ncbi:MAG TPA: beta-propeller domain-containing protein [Solirubrobacteraceae bacterium]
MRRGLAVALVLASACVAAMPAAVLAKRAPARLRAFSSCAGLVGYAQRHLSQTHGVPERVVPGLVEPAMPGRRPQATAAPQEAAPAYSTTNVQEEGVDEPDLAKTDGTTIFTVVGQTLYAIAADGPGAPRIAGSLALGRSGGDVVLHAGRLIVIQGAGAVPLDTVSVGPVPRAASVPFEGQTVITEVDVRDPTALKVARTLTLDGQYVNARQNGGTVRVVLSSTPRAYALPAARDRASGWVPRLRFASRISGRRRARALVSCDDVRRPPTFSGLGMLSILTVDLDKGLWAVDADGVMTDAQTVYGSRSHLYVATQRWIDPQTQAGELPGASTLIHRFDVGDPDKTTYEASGAVTGYLLNQYSLSERKGDLRVASTTRPMWWQGTEGAPSQSLVTVLRGQGSRLAPIGQVAGLGRGQRIYSVRFIGDVGYVVTFRQIDPLYTIGLADPTAPKVLGELELLGYSAYLHPLSADRLLGVGQDATPEGRTKGVQVSLFGVGDPAHPRLLAQHALGASSSSQVEYDSHAFLYWAPRGLVVLPVQVDDDGAGASPGFTGAVALKVGPDRIDEVGRVAHDAVDGSVPLITRSIVIGDRLLTLSDGGVLASALEGFGRLAWLPFP